MNTSKDLKKHMNKCHNACYDNTNEQLNKIMNTFQDRKVKFNKKIESLKKT